MTEKKENIPTLFEKKKRNTIILKVLVVLIIFIFGILIIFFLINIFSSNKDNHNLNLSDNKSSQNNNDEEFKTSNDNNSPTSLEGNPSDNGINSSYISSEGGGGSSGGSGSSGSCTPNCINKECGDDGCGGSCDTCEDDFICIDNSCIESCIDDNDCSINNPFCIKENCFECKNNGDCNDNIDCTVDECVLGCRDTYCSFVECRNIPNNDMCNEGEVCDSGLGCITDSCYQKTCGSYMSEDECNNWGCELYCSWENGICIENLPLPIIPGETGFGIFTTAGSGRSNIDSVIDSELDNKIVAWWDFDDLSVNDSKYSGINGTVIGNVNYVSEGMGNSIHIVSSNDFVNLSNPLEYLPENHSFSVSFWIYLNDSMGSSQSYITNLGGSSSWHFYTTPDGDWMYRISNGSNDLYTHLPSTGAGPRWRQIVGTYNSSDGILKYYFNGKYVHNAWGASHLNLNASSSRNLMIQGGNNYVDNLILFDDALTDGEIYNLYLNQTMGYNNYSTEVYKVTNLNDSGLGSLRYGIESQERPRTIVFETSGTILIEEDLRMGPLNSYLTIAGQTAPNPGITIRGKTVQISSGVNDILIQHLRFRSGDILNGKSADSQDSFEASDEVSNLVLDHCSFSWSIDEVVELMAKDSSIINSFITEGLNSPLHSKGGHSKGMLVKSNRDIPDINLLIAKNLFAFNSDRSPAVEAGNVIVSNNYLYKSYGSKFVDAKYPIIGSYVGNYIENSSISMSMGWFNKSRIFFGRNNFLNGHIQLIPWASGFYGRLRFSIVGIPVPESTKIDYAPIWPKDYSIIPVKSIPEFVLINSGARPLDRDPVDIRIINQVRNKTGEIILSQDDVGGWTVLAENIRVLNIPANYDEIQASGYTTLEEWIQNYTCNVEGGNSSSCPSVCGDLKCEGGENCNSCLTDCGCNAGEVCNNKYCIEPLCNNDLDCGNNPCFNYTCSDSGTNSSKCTYTIDSSCETINCNGLRYLYHFDNDKTVFESIPSIHNWAEDYDNYNNYDNNNLFCANDGCPSFENQGKFGSAVKFDGINDHYRTNLETGNLSEFTLSLWYKQSINDGGIMGEDRPIHIKTYGDQLKITVTNILQQQICSGFIPVLYDEWTYINLRYNLTDCIIYTNETYYYIDAIDNQVLYGNYQNRFGLSSGSWRDFYNGSLDEISLWEKVLSDSEVEMLSNNQIICDSNDNFVSSSSGSSSTSSSSLNTINPFDNLINWFNELFSKLFTNNTSN
ncbi:hypothetical protein GOV12_03720 [Candidatus Pacearchaeota archaeon]|nr:hypothetical protein [Candidatus Pacearchaeota archaeon]